MNPETTVASLHMMSCVCVCLRKRAAVFQRWEATEAVWPGLACPCDEYVFTCREWKSRRLLSSSHPCGVGWGGFVITHCTQAARLDAVIGGGVTATCSKASMVFTSAWSHDSPAAVCTPGPFVVVNTDKCQVNVKINKKQIQTESVSSRFLPHTCLNTCKQLLLLSVRLMSLQNYSTRCSAAESAHSAPRAAALWLTVKQVILWAPYLWMGPLIMVRSITAASFTHSCTLHANSGTGWSRRAI